MSARRLIVAGTHSGVGKTTITLALMAALRRRGLTVQPFKVGPDFIDPGHHTAVCGRISRNLDTWMLSDEVVRDTYSRACDGADISIIEGVMGLFDGRSAADQRGSTAHLAKVLDAPVLLVVDAEGAAASIAATVKGFAELDPSLHVPAVLCNRVAGPKHYGYLEPAIRRHTSVQPVGWLPRNAEWHIPERHLGLVTAHDFADAAFKLDHLAAAFEATVNVELLLRLSAGRVISTPSARPLVRRCPRRIAVARDAAFCFYYEDNLDLLRTAGAGPLPFSPLSDSHLPEDVTLIYLGGGYPELHAERLAANRSMTQSMRRFHQQGGAIYAECGGLMYCCRELVDGAGRVFPMLDLLPARTVMQPRRAALGYVTWRGTANTLLGSAGTEVRGHEFHYSRLEALGSLQPAAVLLRDDEDPRLDGFVSGRLLAGYAHLHFASNPAVMDALLQA